IACFEQVRAANTIVTLPTGKGKTLIAVLAIDHFRAQVPDKWVVFIVPTRTLVSQMAEYCEQHCKERPEAAQLCGLWMDSWDDMRWRECLRKHRVLVGTPEVFRVALGKGYLAPDKVSLLVFDECHNATGNSPMAAIMKDSIHGATVQPRILGLTASFVHGKLKRKRDAETAKFLLEELLLANICCPTVPEEPSTGPGRQWLSIPYPKEQLEEEFGQTLEELVTNLTQGCDPQGHLKELHKVMGRLKHVFGQLGRDGFVYCVQKSVVHHLEHQAIQLAALSATRGRGELLQAQLPALRARLRSCAQQLITDARLLSAPRRSQKAETLLNLISQKLAGRKGIVFVTQVLLTCPLADSINKQVHAEGMRAEGIYSGMAKADQDAAMKGFREGRTHVLVATDVLLEGVDVPDCEWIVRFNDFHTTKSHVQGSGRARSENAEVYYFENDPETETDRAQ
ncbi:unnamed protein product, partial [Polarella glacialis]